ncbi:MAG: transglycosylase SLT domain-containing protein [Bryobacteraceae bacterium]
MSLTPSAAMAVVLGAALTAWPVEPAYFVPSHRLPGIGAGRQELTEETLARRTEAMVQSQTFSIMREPQALAGARRIWGDDLQRLFQDAERKSGFPAAVLQAIAYLESWGNAKAESPAGPRGIMQIAEATGKRMGLRIVYSVRHQTTKTKTAVRDKHGKLVYRTVRHKTTYTVLVRDDRLKPEKAIPAAAQYLAGLEQRLGGRDWAIWAYHCGEGCIADIRSIARAAQLPGYPPATVTAVFFGCSPVWNRALYQALHAQMERDYSPTYWFRVMRAQQLLRMYLDDPVEFQDVVEEYKYRTDSTQRAPDRLSAWLKPQDLIYETSDATHSDGSKLVRAPDDPDFLGYRVAAPPAAENGNGYPAALPSTIGTLAYIAFETRRLYEAMRAAEEFVPLDVTALFLPKNGRPGDGAGGARAPDHASGQVFDISVARLPAGERECLRFVLDDLGWSGHLGFIEDGKQTLHIGCSPSSRDFFASVFEEEQTALRNKSAPAVSPATPGAGERR